MLQLRIFLKIGQALQSIRYKTHESLSASYNQKDWGAMQEWISLHALHGIVKPT